MKRKIDEMNLFFEEKMLECEKRKAQLLEDDRADEADFEKIRANIYDVFRTVLSAAHKACGEDEEAVKSFFMTKTEQIPASWRVSLEKAQVHGDERKMCVEKIKLAAAEEIREKFKYVWEGKK